MPLATLSTSRPLLHPAGQAGAPRGARLRLLYPDTFRVTILSVSSEFATVVERKTFRDAMARLGAAVNVITTLSSGEAFGLTASAVCSVTDDPPTLLLCINRDTDLNEVLKVSRFLCVNTLSAGQEELSPVFAGLTGIPQAERFKLGAWTTLETGAPVLEDAVVSFDCRISQFVEVGTHTVFFCEVQAIKSGAAHEGLIYFGRAYHRIIVEAA